MILANFSSCSGSFTVLLPLLSVCRCVGGGLTAVKAAGRFESGSDSSLRPFPMSLLLVVVVILGCRVHSEHHHKGDGRAKQPHHDPDFASEKKEP